ncbi:NAD(P)-dependent oxidoreductase [Kribbella sp. NPDC004536]|uniref:NAD(P)-dependent oxidoreductase n=1 Tax=Kribbella sp. NPDC004536 TaxID=3364106 RepID=UPI00369E3A4C
MKLAISEANGPTGRLATAQALTERHTITAITRHPETFPLADPALQVVAADSREVAAVTQAIGGHDAVRSTIGVPYGSDAPTTLSESATCIVAATTTHGIRRLVCVTSTGVPMKPAPGETFFYRKTVVPLLLKTRPPTVRGRRPPGTDPRRQRPSAGPSSARPASSTATASPTTPSPNPNTPAASPPDAT